ncbi:MAG: 2OG-Fe(II) oxygenase [Alphaproteobacteria bacterium]|nr:2OG-Fe(II) oxygenase [Alphaproteobacteria bacterium]MBV8549545.1 2OG-Fe(II) oxygenase [Alphaproteobacteria bacterium]
MMNAQHHAEPYDYWLLRDVFPHKVIDALLALPFPKPANPIFNGRRESNNSSRIYFSPDNQRQYAICRELVSLFSSPATIRDLEMHTGADLSQGQLRIEYCQDVDGFWLEPHLDLGVKLFTMLVYLSNDPKLYDAGTDIYDTTPEHNLVATAPYEYNTGLIFIPGQNTWHGFSKRTIHGLRKSIIINYVSPEWRNRAELAYPER